MINNLKNTRLAFKINETYNIAIYNIAIYNIAIYNIAIYNIAIYNIAIYNTAIYNTAIYNIAIYNIAIYNIAIYNIAIYNIAIYNIAIYNIAIYNIAIHNRKTSQHLTILLKTASRRIKLNFSLVKNDKSEILLTMLYDLGKRKIFRKSVFLISCKVFYN